MNKFIYNSEVIQDNLEEMWSAISLSSFLEGKEWYWIANSIAQDIADTYNVPIEVICGVMASMSPQKSWEENIKLCKRYIEDPHNFKGHVRKMVGKAHIISMWWQGYKDRKGFIERILNGPKIVSFFNNMLNPYDNSYITIDTHHLSICLGDSKINTCTPKQYEFLRQETLKFAKKQNLIGNEVQAILWTHYRKNK